MNVEQGTYPMIGIIPDRQWRPDNEAAVMAKLNAMIMPSILGECFQEGQRISALMHDAADWTITRDRAVVDAVGYIHDCPECRDSREGCVQFMLEHDDAFIFVGIVKYHAVIRDPA